MAVLLDVFLEIKNLHKDMRSTNVAQYGLKPVIHENWVKRLDSIKDKLEKELSKLDKQ